MLWVKLTASLLEGWNEVRETKSQPQFQATAALGCRLRSRAAKRLEEDKPEADDEQDQ